MLNTKFYSQKDFDFYIVEQKIRKENKCLTVSERKQLEEMIKNPKSYIFEKPKDNPNIKKIVTDIRELRKPCQKVEKGENVSQIIKELKATLEEKKALGLTANQIGYAKAISYIKIMKPIDPKKKEINYTELVLINPKIIEKANPIKMTSEGCLSFPGVSVQTRRYIFCTVTFLDEKFEERTGLFQDLEAFCVEHEIDHTNGKTIFDAKWTDPNKRKK